MFKVGQMVVISKGMPCCGYTGFRHFNVPFTIGSFNHARGELKCYHCQEPIEGEFAISDDNEVAALCRMLTKIDPPTEYKGEQRILSLFNVKPREVQDA